jgi:enoyl-CoA hydratase/carnithine racemase
MTAGEPGAVAVAEQLVLTEHDGRVTTITLNRLRQRNAMNRAARMALVGALDEARERGSSVIVLTAPPPAFCAGMDLKEGAAEADRAGPAPAAGRSGATCRTRSGAIPPSSSPRSPATRSAAA